jgi:starch synthase
MHVYFAAAELAPFAKVGGLADVVGSLPKALHDRGVEATVLFPYYAGLNLEGAEVEETGETLEIAIAGGTQTVTLAKTTLPGSSVPVLLFGHDAWIGNGGTYASVPPAEFPNVHPDLPRFALFSAAIAKYVAEHAEPGTILHAHDWHVAASIPILKNAYGTAHISTLLTIHNLAYQGGTGFASARTVFGDDLLRAFPKESLLGEEPHMWYNLLLAGILSADWVSTVSPTYRNEILTPEYGERLGWALAQRDDRLVGILNGIDTEGWNPETDKFVEVHYSAEDALEKKRENKVRLQRTVGLPENPDAFLVGMVSRISEQ